MQFYSELFLLFIANLPTSILALPFFPKKAAGIIPLGNNKIIRGEVLCVEIDMVYPPNSSTVQLFYAGQENKLLAETVTDENGHFELKGPSSLGDPACKFFIRALSTCDVLNEQCRFVKQEAVPASVPELFSKHPGRHQYAVSMWIRTDTNEPQCSSSNSTLRRNGSRRIGISAEDSHEDECLIGMQEWR